MEGVDMVARLVGVTLGPRGRNVVLQNKYALPRSSAMGRLSSMRCLLDIKSDGESSILSSSHPAISCLLLCFILSGKVANAMVTNVVTMEDNAVKTNILHGRDKHKSEGQSLQ